MKYEVKKKFAPVEIRITLLDGRELANFCKSMLEFGKQYEADYDDRYFTELAEEINEIKREKVESGEMVLVE